MHDALTGVLLALTIVIGISVLIQVGVVLALAVAAFKTRRKVHELLDHYHKDLEPQITPIVANVRGIVEDLTPKVKTISTNAVDVSHTVRDEAKKVGHTVNEVMSRTHHQAARVDDIVTDTLDGIGNATSAVQHGLSLPIRQISSIIYGIKVGVEKLRQTERE